LEQFLVVRNTIFAIDEAVRKDLLAIVLAGGSEAIPGLASILSHRAGNFGSGRRYDLE
jgi:actin-related protein